MVWDLRGALLKKEERESARLAAFEFQHRARTFRALAEELNLDATTIVSLIARFSDAAALEEIARLNPSHAGHLNETYQRCRTKVRAQLVQELGDPAPHKLA